MRISKDTCQVLIFECVCVCVCVCVRDSDKVQGLCYAPHTRQLISCGSDGGIVIWNMDVTRQEVREILYRARMKCLVQKGLPRVVFMLVKYVCLHSLSMSSSVLCLRLLSGLTVTRVRNVNSPSSGILNRCGTVRKLACDRYSQQNHCKNK